MEGYCTFQTQCSPGMGLSMSGGGLLLLWLVLLPAESVPPSIYGYTVYHYKRLYQYSSLNSSANRGRIIIIIIQPVGPYDSEPRLIEMGIRQLSECSGNCLGKERRRERILINPLHMPWPTNVKAEHLGPERQ